MPGLNETPIGSRLHIAIFGRRNAGKSSLINALTNQQAAIVSEVAGTTTDPVIKAMEILPLGPVVIIDTAGIDDSGVLGEKRVRRTLQVLDRAEMALLVLDREHPPDGYEEDLVRRIREREIPLLAVANKSDLGLPEGPLRAWAEEEKLPYAAVSALTREGIDHLKQLMIQHAPTDKVEPPLVGDLVRPGDLAVLVIPIDKAAPKGRLILPQVMTLRDLLDHDAYGLVVKERELRVALAGLGQRPRLVVTDSQALLKAAADTPRDIPFTSFSILFARYKGDLEYAVRSTAAIGRLRPGDRVLIAEACTHHRQPDDIGNVQIPRWLRQLVGGELRFSWASGQDFPVDTGAFDLVVHCGGCMVNRQEMLSRVRRAREAGVPMTNYGVLLAYVHGVLERALGPFPWAQAALEETQAAEQAETKEEVSCYPEHAPTE